jgi:hypothetical protein
MALQYPDMVRLIRSGILIAAIAFGVVPPGAAQQKGSPSAPKDQMFSGIVTAMNESSVTAIRTTGQKDSKTFAVTSATRFEGKPLVNSRVTIRYVTTEDGDRAIVVIVRANTKK